MTELSPVSHTTPDVGCEPPGVAGDVPKGSVGYAIPNTECRLVDPAHRRGRRRRASAASCGSAARR